MTEHRIAVVIPCYRDGELAAEARKDLGEGKSDTEIRETKQQQIDAQNKKHRRRTKKQPAQ